ncbi:MAG: uracil-DNA glycosylase family protein [Sphingobium sp.]|uniref:uracil-DNA glycosylase family protein n=1 Tax=Sphingobium sp. TaxID=1912891 RepID=UPI0029A901B3|nr:uracil-DNA glycosylase family protein [Sphingobium sp.]MDX3908501.1 uracil-DNA glycosylase family protein [Sphingobium sp.]
MDFVGEFNATSSVDSLIDWWETAGVVGAVSEEPVNWLQPRSAPSSPPVDATALPSPAAAEHVWPESLEAFQDWLAQDDSLPELAWPQLSGQSKRVLPTGPTAPFLMVVCDMPDLEDVGTGSLLGESAGRLFDAMLNAIGLARAEVYMSSLALTRPAGGIVNDADLAQLAKRMRHHISLVGPRKLLLLGDKVSRALIPTVDAKNVSGLRLVNHEGGTLETIATMHPRVLLKQPAAKMACWRQLQLLIEAQPA